MLKIRRDSSGFFSSQPSKLVSPRRSRKWTSSSFKTTEEQAKASSFQELLQELTRVKDLMSRMFDDQTIEREITRLFTSEASPAEESPARSVSTETEITLQNRMDREDEEFERY